MDSDYSLYSQTGDCSITLLTEKARALFQFFDAWQKRLWAATEALAIGRVGIAAVHNATGLCDTTIRRGIKDIQEETPLDPSRIRKKGGGRKTVTQKNITLEHDLDQLIRSTTRGNPMNPLRWTTKSLRNLGAELQQMGHTIGTTALRTLLKQKGYSLQANRKTREGEDHPDQVAKIK